MPDQISKSDAELVSAVNVQIKKRGQRGVSHETILRAAGAQCTRCCFLSKVETEDWKPGEEKLRKIAEVICCEARAGRVPTELSEIIKQSPHRHQMTALLRTAKGFTAEEMEKLVSQAQKIKQK